MEVSGNFRSCCVAAAICAILMTTSHMLAAPPEQLSLTATPWADLIGDAGVDEAGIRRLADVYMASERVIIAWCLGLTQHEHGVDTVREIVNLLLLRGNIGREGTGALSDPRAQQRAGQPHLRDQPPSG